MAESNIISTYSFNPVYESFGSNRNHSVQQSHLLIYNFQKPMDFQVHFKISISNLPSFFCCRDWSFFPNALIQILLALKSEGKHLQITHKYSQMFCTPGDKPTAEIWPFSYVTRTQPHLGKNIFGPGGRFRAIVSVKESHRMCIREASP